MRRVRERARLKQKTRDVRLTCCGEDRADDDEQRHRQQRPGGAPHPAPEA